MSAPWTAAELARATAGRMPVPFDARGVSIDTRTLRPGELFVALRGDNGDGHAHVADALNKGAAGAMVHRTDGIAPGAPLLVVADTLGGLAALGRAGRARFDGRLVAVTGSVGKTTTKEMLRRMLAAFGPTHAAEASHNNHWGVPLTLARLPADAAFCVAEIGMNHAGEIAPLARLARPHVAVVTAVEAAHIGHLGSLDAIADEKAQVAAGLERNGALVLPGDSSHLPRLRDAAGGHAVRLFGVAGRPDARLDAVKGDHAGSRIEAVVHGTAVRFALAAPGRHMAMNALAALEAAALLGIDPARAAAALDGFAPVAGRGARRVLPNGVTLLDESYNASSASVRAALAVLGLLPARRRLAVLGDMLELGEHGAAEHAGLGAAVLESADLLYACGPLMRRLFDAVPEGRRGAHAPDSAALAPVVAAAVRPGDAVLVKGSLGSRMRLVVDALAAERNN